MAVFEKKIPRKVCIDDTEILTATIENAQNVNGHTEYIIRVQRGPLHEKSWFVCKRYNDFVALHALLQMSGIALSLPPKKIIGNMERNFIAERQTALQNYLHVVLMNPILALSLCVRKFLDPQNYAVSLQEQALQHVSMALRSEMNYELLKPLPDMGWRLRKHYFSVSAKNSTKSEVLLQWVDYGPDKCLPDKDLQSVLKFLSNLNHPHIEKIEYFHFGDGGCFVIRQFYQHGSLRDLVCCTKPKMPYLKKYGNPKHTKALSVSEIALYGHQILEALNFLHKRGIPYGHLHLGNIVLVDNKVKLLDIENSVLGLPSYYRPFFIQHKKINTMEAIDVYSFGHVLFEMAYGYPLQESVCDNLPTSCTASLRAVMESILSSESCKAGMPSPQELMEHPFFASSLKNESVKPNCKLSSSIRESLATSVQSIEHRLKEEQRIVRHQKKISRMQEILCFEEKVTKKSQRPKEDRKSLQKQQNANNVDANKSSPRSESPTSTSTATSAGTVTPPLSGNLASLSDANFHPITRPSPSVEELHKSEEHGPCTGRSLSSLGFHLLLRQISLKTDTVSCLSHGLTLVSVEAF